MSGLVVIADGDSERGKRIAEACSARGLACSVTTHGAAALEEALAEAPAVLVCQLDLPLIDGPRLAAILDANPRTRGIAMIFLADRSVGEQLADLSGQVMEPPVDPDQVASCVQALVAQQAPRAKQAESEESGVEGELAQLSLADLLELFHLSRKTGVVELGRRGASNRRQVGRVELRGGDVIHASVGEVEGVKAFFRLLTWDRGSFSFRSGAVTAMPSIQTPTRALLREGQRQLLEGQRLGVELPPLDAEVRLKIQRSALPNVIHPLTQEVLLVLEMHSRVRDVLDRCSFPDYQVLCTLHTLIARGIVELRRDPEPLRSGAEGGLFSPAHVERLREWLGGAGGRSRRGRDAKLLVLSSDLEATCEFAALLDALQNVEIDARFAAGAFDAGDLLALGHLPVEGNLGIELLHVPADEEFAPFWATAGHGALATLVLLSSPVGEALDRLRQAVEELKTLPRARLFHLLLLSKGERVEPEAIRENLSLLDDGSLFLIPLDQHEKAAALLREAFGRVLP